MVPKKSVIADYFTFSRKDRIAITCLIALITGIFLLPSLISSSETAPSSADTAWISSLESLKKKQEPNRPGGNDNTYTYQFDRTESGYYGNRQRELFYFDPNTISGSEWERLGLRPKTIRTIQNYLSKGGRFRNPEDLSKIYGLPKDEYTLLAPYIRIAPSASSVTENNAAKPERKPYAPRYETVDINSADTTAFIALPGIGSKLAARIISFREKLGGFYSIEQVRETYALPDSTFQKIKSYLKLETTSIKQININTATIDELKAHPYIRYQLAKPIVAYREQHGPFDKTEDIKKVMVITEDVYEKIAPYLSVQ